MALRAARSPAQGWARPDLPTPRGRSKRSSTTPLLRACLVSAIRCPAWAHDDPAAGLRAAGAGLTDRRRRFCSLSGRGPGSSSKRDGASRSGSRIMDRKRPTVLRRLLPFLLFTLCAPLVVVSPLLAVGQMTAATATRLGNGIWTVQGRAIPGRRQCGDWLVRLMNAGGQLSGVVSLARASVPIQNLTLLPDGSFSGTTRAGLVGSSHARAYKVTGKFSGDSVSLTLQDNICPPRHGMAMRQAAAG